MDCHLNCLDSPCSAVVASFVPSLFVLDITFSFVLPLSSWRIGPSPVSFPQLQTGWHNDDKESLTKIIGSENARAQGTMLLLYLWTDYHKCFLPWLTLEAFNYYHRRVTVVTWKIFWPRGYQGCWELGTFQRARAPLTSFIIFLPVLIRQREETKVSGGASGSGLAECIYAIWICCRSKICCLCWWSAKV